MEINLDEWKWLRKISGLDTETLDQYRGLARKNEAMIVAVNGEYSYNIYIPEVTKAVDEFSKKSSHTNTKSSRKLVNKKENKEKNYEESS